jgi:hypothetical protein
MIKSKKRDLKTMQGETPILDENKENKFRKLNE